MNAPLLEGGLSTRPGWLSSVTDIINKTQTNLERASAMHFVGITSWRWMRQPTAAQVEAIRIAAGLAELSTGLAGVLLRKMYRLDVDTDDAAFVKRMQHQMERLVEIVGVRP